jgi:hypothetical protein
MSKPGPKTIAGKTRSSINALRHGLTSRLVVLPSEDMSAYLKFSKEFMASLRPASPIENEIAQNIADGYWRLKRVRTVEESLYALGHEEEPRDLDEAFMVGKTFRDRSQAFVNLSTYEQRIQRNIEKNIKLLRELQAERKREIPQALELRELNKSKNIPYDPSEDGFVYSPAEIELEAHRQYRREEASELAWRQCQGQDEAA